MSEQGLVIINEEGFHAVKLSKKCELRTVLPESEVYMHTYPCHSFATPFSERNYVVISCARVPNPSILREALGIGLGPCNMPQLGPGSVPRSRLG